METGYDVEPRPIRGSARGRVWLVVLAVARLPRCRPREAMGDHADQQPVEAAIASPQPVASPAFAVIRIQPTPALRARLAGSIGRLETRRRNCEGGGGRAG